MEPYWHHNIANNHTYSLTGNCTNDPTHTGPQTQIAMYDRADTATVLTAREDFIQVLYDFAEDYPTLCRPLAILPDGTAQFQVAQKAILLTVAHPDLVDLLAAYL